MAGSTTLNIKKAFNYKAFNNFYGRGGEDRTPINGFGDRYTTIVPHPYAPNHSSIFYFQM